MELERNFGQQGIKKHRSLERTRGLSRMDGHVVNEALFWPLASLNVLLGLYFVERWLLRPRVLEWIGAESSRNFGVPDLYVLAYFLLLFLSPGGKDAILRVVKFFGPMLLLYLAGGWGSTFVGAGMGSPDFPRSFWASAQISFCFLILGPVLLNASERTGFRRAVLSYATWIGIGGLLSVTDRLGVTNLGNQEYYRLENVLLGVNGFYVVGLLVPLLLYLLTQAIGRGQSPLAALIVAILVFSHLGLALAGVRTGLILAGFGWTVGMWVCVRYGEWRRIKVPGYIVGVGLVAIAAGLLVGTAAGREIFSFEIFLKRSEVVQGLFADDDRLFVYNLAWSDIIYNGAWLIGNGVNQWVIVHPNIEVIHNVFLLAWWEGGLLGFAGWALIYIRPAAGLFFGALGRGGTTPDRGLIWGAGFCIAGTAIGGLAYPIGYSRSDWLWFIVAVSPVLLHRVPRTSQGHPAKPFLDD